ncbi:MAG: hypothetical protein G8237_14295 [Magnetococcales bacterium]|nr:hypothetical protein [Magnetococcales bacterium]
MAALFAQFDPLIAELLMLWQPATVLLIQDDADHYGQLVQARVAHCHLVRITDLHDWMQTSQHQETVADLVIIGCGMQALLKSTGMDLLGWLSYRSGAILAPILTFPTTSQDWPLDGPLPLSVWGRQDFAWSDACAHAYAEQSQLFLLRGLHLPLARFRHWITPLNRICPVDLLLANPCATLEEWVEPDPPVLLPTLDDLRCATDTAMAEQRVEESLGLIRHLKQQFPESNPFEGEFFGRVSAFVVNCFNGALSSGNLKEAERVITLILDVFPPNKELLHSALMIHIQLGQPEEALRIRERLIDYCQQHKDIEEEIAQRLYLVEHHLHRMQPLFALYSVNRILDLLLCGTLDAAKIDQIDGLIQRSRLVDTASLQPETMEMFFRVAIDNVRIRSILAPTPEDLPWPDVWFSSADGRLMDPTEVAAQAQQQGVRVLFFAAGDEIYVQRFGKLYAASILKSCDLPCQVVIHVIGAAERVTEVARSIGIVDARLIFSADRFDPTQVTSRCHTTPPFKAHPLAAHYQSARFLWLGYMLTLFERPMFVSDIDLILQRGVADLLATHARDDVVLLRDPHHPNYQTYNNKFHAGLIFFNPTPIARRMVRFMRHDLITALGQSEIDRWVDQVALMMSHHHIAALPEARVALFSPLDINHDLFVLTSYTETPYRFFALTNFIDFDIESYYKHFLVREPEWMAYVPGVLSS